MWTAFRLFLVVGLLLSGLSLGLWSCTESSPSGCTAAQCGEGTVCDPETGTCVVEQEDVGSSPECEADTDCDDATMKCLEGACVSKCEGVECDLAAGEVCDPTNGTCVGGDNCANDDDCNDGDDKEYVCADGSCLGLQNAECQERSCVEGLDCLEGLGTKLCMAPCKTGADCQVTDRCITEAPEIATSFNNHCLFNVCRPGGDEYGLFQDAEFLGPCDVQGSPDGLCVGPIPGDDGPIGICFGLNGQAGHGDTCSPAAKHGAADACNNGLCLDDDLVCADFCILFDGEPCLDGNGCFAIFGLGGVCAPTGVEEPSAPGEPCNPIPVGLSCGEDAMCIVDETGQYRCALLCDSTAADGAPGACAEGSCAVDDDKTIGICVVETSEE